jgi:hypothetical protein
MSAMKLRRTVTLGLATALLLSGCTDDPEPAAGQTVEIVAGGGANPAATKSLDADVTGSVSDLEVGRDGVIRLLTVQNQRVFIWVFRPRGDAQRIELEPRIRSAVQLAVADDGTMYVSHSTGPVGIVSKIAADGKTTPVIGDGKEGFTADGSAALGPAFRIAGIAVDREGRLVYGELRLDSAADQQFGLLRRVGSDGRIETIAGIPGPLPKAEYGHATVGSVAPPPGTKALTWPLPGTSQLKSLAVDDDGVVYAQSERGVLAFPSDGTVKSVARRREPKAAPIGDDPFSREGEAADADPSFQEVTGISADAGRVSMPVTAFRPEGEREIPVAFRWMGDYSEGQRTLVDAVAKEETGSGEQNVIRLVQPDGSVTTAVWAAEAAALRNGELYVVGSTIDDRMMVGRVKVPG